MNKKKAKYPIFRPVKTVGALRKQLEQLPASLPLTELMHVQVYNTGECPEGWNKENWGPRVGVEEKL